MGVVVKRHAAWAPSDMKSDLRGSKDFLSGLLFLAIGAGAIVVARDYSFGTAMRMGSG